MPKSIATDYFKSERRKLLKLGVIGAGGSLLLDSSQGAFARDGGGGGVPDPVGAPALLPIPRESLQKVSEVAVKDVQYP